MFVGLTRVGDGGDCDSVVGFACAEARHHILDPPQLPPDLGFLLLRHKSINSQLVTRKKKKKIKKNLLPLCVHAKANEKFQVVAAATPT